MLKTQAASRADAQSNSQRQLELGARIERLPLTGPVLWIRSIIGSATFFDGYTVLTIAYAMPVLVREWHLNPNQTGAILSLGYLGTVFGAVLFGALAERLGRLRILLFTVLIFVSMDVACLFAVGALSMMLFRFVQGIGTGGEVPVASAYINEYIGSKNRGRFFLLYEATFLLGLVAAGLIGSQLVPIFGWRAMFVVGIIPAVVMIPLRFFMKESPRWLASKGRFDEAERIVADLEKRAMANGHTLPAPVVASRAPIASSKNWLELFQGIYRRRTLTIWAMWFCSYMVANGMIAWLPTLYMQTFKLPLATSLRYGLLTSFAGLIAAVICAQLIDRVGRRRWYIGAFLLAPVALAVLAFRGASAPTEVLVLAGLAYAVVQTITFSLYLYSAEIYPTRLRAIGTGFGSALARLGSSAGPLVVGTTMASFGIQYVFGLFACILLVGAAVTAFGAIETRSLSLEELSP